MKTYVITDRTSNSGKIYIACDHTNVELIENAMIFESIKDAQNFIDENHYNEWADITEV